jgi:hypothetical protein
MGIDRPDVHQPMKSPRGILGEKHWIIRLLPLIKHGKSNLAHMH